MPALARNLIFDAAHVGVYHCLARCVRRAFLCGFDRLSGQDFEHRRQWLRERLEILAGIFGLDVLGFAVMANHLHVVLRNRPDVVAAWSDEELARAWWRLYPHRREPDGSPAEPAPAELGLILGDAVRTAELRRRLCSISWFMRALCEPLAKQANREDGCTGRFWEGRFKSQPLLDEAAVLACGVYVDLNPIRAGLAATPETSEFTSVQERIAAWQATPSDARPSAPVCDSKRPASESSPMAGPGSASSAPSASASCCSAPRRDGWLSPVPLDEVGSPQESTGRRASDQGFLPLSLVEYLQLVDWTGRQLRSGKRGAIAVDAPPILARLGLAGGPWLRSIALFGKLFRQAVGRSAALRGLARARGRRWLHGMAAARLAFG